MSDRPKILNKENLDFKGNVVKAGDTVLLFNVDIDKWTYERVIQDGNCPINTLYEKTIGDLETVINTIPSEYLIVVFSEDGKKLVNDSKTILEQSELGIHKTASKILLEKEGRNVLVPDNFYKPHNQERYGIQEYIS